MFFFRNLVLLFSLLGLVWAQSSTSNSTSGSTTAPSSSSTQSSNSTSASVQLSTSGSVVFHNNVLCF
ncbi:hypothetical protein BT96DRAFT_969307 [Gymnopus androsaceus JB14]|uniref:REJ domain-containing protein n=1 Tax=Gymnopus androsaceus JB14 TaxID=1447944 RepID=A0A6A4IU17_9AGAR|nr:hypothetical protein BT96DRAFT_969307 [Gymnopus androsaceus JB14]